MQLRRGESGRSTVLNRAKFIFSAITIGLCFSASPGWAQQAPPLSSKAEHALQKTQHPWFMESRSSRTNPKRDWYIWRDGKEPGQPPNNWQSWFGHSAWQLDPATNQYYYHHFYTEQPDLNWRNPEVRKAMHDALRFWF